MNRIYQGRVAKVQIIGKDGNATPFDSEPMRPGNDGSTTTPQSYRNPVADGSTTNSSKMPSTSASSAYSRWHHFLNEKERLQ